jgi:hypothetical protein
MKYQIRFFVNELSVNMRTYKRGKVPLLPTAGDEVVLKSENEAIGKLYEVVRKHFVVGEESGLCLGVDIHLKEKTTGTAESIQPETIQK